MHRVYLEECYKHRLVSSHILHSHIAFSQVDAHLQAVNHEFGCNLGRFQPQFESMFFHKFNVFILRFIVKGHLALIMFSVANSMAYKHGMFNISILN